MLTKFIIILTLFLSVKSSISQILNPGFAIGLNQRWLNDQRDLPDYFGKKDILLFPSFNFALTNDYPINQKLFIHSGLRYLLLGNKMNFKGISTTNGQTIYKALEKINLEYISLYNDLEYHFGNFYLSLGIESSFLISANYYRQSEVIFNNEPIPGTLRINIKDDLTNINISGRISGGYTFQLFEKIFVFRLVYNHGFNSISNMKIYDFYIRSINMVISYML